MSYRCREFARQCWRNGQKRAQQRWWLSYLSIVFMVLFYRIKRTECPEFWHQKIKENSLREEKRSSLRTRLYTDRITVSAWLSARFQLLGRSRVKEAEKCRSRDLLSLARDRRDECGRGYNPAWHPRSHVGTRLKGILVGIFVACRVKNCQHLNRPRLVDEKRGYRPDADASQLDTRLSAKCPRVHVVDYDSFIHPDSRSLLVVILPCSKMTRRLMPSSCLCLPDCASPLNDFTER